MKKEVTKYFNLCLWFALNQDSKDYTIDQFEQVLIKIGNLEDQLRDLGTSEKRIQKLIDQAAKAYKMKLAHSMSESHLFRGDSLKAPVGQRKL